MDEIESLQCSACGQPDTYASLSDDTRFCPKCGASQTALRMVTLRVPPRGSNAGYNYLWRCPGCGKDHTDAYRFCPQCGISEAGNRLPR